MAAMMLGLLLAIALTGFVLEGARIAVELPAFEMVSVVGYPIALLLRGLGLNAEALLYLHRATWLTHAILCITFFALGTAYLFRHLLISALAVAFTPVRRSTGALRPYPLTVEEGLATGLVSDLLVKDLVDADACTTCGRCTSVCPAAAAGKALDPRTVVLKLSDLIGRQVTKNGTTPSAFDTVTSQELWDCTTCGACNHACPVNIQVFDKIIDLRRQLVDLGRVSPSAQTALEGISARANPWAYPPNDRGVWKQALNLPVAGPERKPEWIYWIGCAGAFEPSAQSIAKTTAEILTRAGVDFAVLGQECCTGDPARRLGDEALFQRSKERTLELLRGSGAKKIVTHCPHCLNTFLNEYPEHELEVVHHSVLIARLIAEKKISLQDQGRTERITYHDPCYLGRHNGEYAAPRAVVDALPGVDRVEMPRAKENALCCGGGGGQMWQESAGKKRVESLRLAEAEATGASTVATGCPFCKVMLESAAASSGKQERIRVRDVSEIIFDAMERA